MLLADAEQSPSSLVCYAYMESQFMIFDILSLISFAEIRAIIFSAVGVIFGAYFMARAKNLATSRDIGKITSQVESVKVHFSESLEKNEGRTEQRNPC